MKTASLILTLLSGAIGLPWPGWALGPERDESPIPEPSVSRIDYARPQDYLLLNASLGNGDRIRELAARMKAGTPEGTLAAIGLWMGTNFRYDSRVDSTWRNFDTAWETKVLGSCADHAIVFAALARACGIPAVFVKTMDADWIREFRTTGACKSWRGHVFLEVFLAGRWRLLDAQSLQLYEEYDPAARILPGNRYAYDKGADPRELVLSLDWERWIKQTAAYFRKFDLARLPVGDGRPLGAVSPAGDGRPRAAVYVAANSPVWQALTQRLRELGCSIVYAFNTEFEKYLGQARGTDLILTCVGDVVVLPEAYRTQLLPVPISEIMQRMKTASHGVLRKRLDDGTQVTLIYGKDLAAIQEAISNFHLRPEP
jgi:transglutaminase-like putative cysteine protease